MTSLGTPEFKCHCCGNTCYPWQEKRTDFGLFRLSRCSHCRSAFVTPKPTYDYIKNFYYENGHNSNYKLPQQVLDAEKKYPNSTLDAQRILTFLNAIYATNGTRFLDVGAGYGLFSREAQKHGCDVTSLEVGTFERQCIKEFTGKDALPYMFEEFEAHDKAFDMILMSQILEHVIEPVNWVHKANNLLKSNGILCIAVPNFNSFFRYLLGAKDPFIIPPEHLNYFTPKGLVALVENAGFEVVAVHHVSRLPFSSRVQGNTMLKMFVGMAEKTFCQLLTMVRLGMFLNVYARRVEDVG